MEVEKKPGVNRIVWKIWVGYCRAVGSMGTRCDWDAPPGWSPGLPPTTHAPPPPPFHRTPSCKHPRHGSGQGTPKCSRGREIYVVAGSIHALLSGSDSFNRQGSVSLHMLPKKCRVCAQGAPKEKEGGETTARIGRRPRPWHWGTQDGRGVWRDRHT